MAVVNNTVLNMTKRVNYRIWIQSNFWALHAVNPTIMLISDKLVTIIFFSFTNIRPLFHNIFFQIDL